MIIAGTMRRFTLVIAAAATAAACTPSVPKPPAASRSVDLGQVMRRAHFAFRRAGGQGFEGGDAAYAAQVTADRLRVTPIGGAAFEVATTSVARGRARLSGPATSGRVLDDGSVRFARGAVEERLQNSGDGVEQSFGFAARPAGAGDLSVSLHVRGLRYAGETAGGLHFVDAATGVGVRYGVGTWVDARGVRTSVRPRYHAATGTIELAVANATVDRSAFPAVLDPVIGPELGIDSAFKVAASGDQRAPAVSCVPATGRCLVVWRDRRRPIPSAGPAFDIFAARLDATTGVLDPSGIAVAQATAGDLGPPAVAFDGANYFMVWADAAKVVGMRVADTSGAVLDANPIVIATTTINAPDPAIAFDGTNYLVAWSTPNIQAARMSKLGIVLDATPIPLTTGTNPGAGPAVGFNGTSYLVSWLSSTTTIFASRVTTDGAVANAAVPVINIGNTNVGRSRIASDGTNFLVVAPIVCSGCGINNTITAARVSGTTGALLGSTNVTSVSSSSTLFDHADVDFDGTNFAVVWGETPINTTDYQVRGGRVTTGGVALGTPVTIADVVGSSQQATTLAFDGTNHFVAWEDNRTSSVSGFDIFYTRFSTAGVSANTTGLLLSSASPDELTPAVATNGSNYLLAWEDHRPSGAADIYGVRIGLDGTSLDSAAIPISQGINFQQQPAVASDGSNYFVVWRDERSMPGVPDIYGARVSATGPAANAVADVQGIPISTATGPQTSPAIAFGGGQYLVTWDDGRTNTTNPDIYAARVSPAGTVLDPNGIAISTATGSQRIPAVAYGSGQFLVVYQNGIQTSGDIFGQLVDATGALVGSSIPISATGASEADPAVTSDGTNFFVAWDTGTDVRGARVTGAGVVSDQQGIDICITTSIQTNPAVAWDGMNFWTVWEDWRNTVTNPFVNVYAGRVSPAGALLDGTGFVVSNDPPSELAPAIASVGGGSGVVAFHRFDKQQPFGAVRIRARLFGGPGSTGTGGAGGATGTGGAGGAGGTGGATGTGGAGGATGTGGAGGAGGATGTGGAGGAGGATGSGGAGGAGAGGQGGSGVDGGGGAGASDGAAGSGGAGGGGTGGSSAGDASADRTTGGTGGAGGTADAGADSSRSSPSGGGGCGCRVADGGSVSGGALLGALALVLARRRRRRD
jgi:hypothetical protein